MQFIAPDAGAHDCRLCRNAERLASLEISCNDARNLLAISRQVINADISGDHRTMARCGTSDHHCVASIIYLSIKVANCAGDDVLS